MGLSKLALRTINKVFKSLDKPSQNLGTGQKSHIIKLIFLVLQISENLNKINAFTEKDFHTHTKTISKISKKKYMQKKLA